MSLSMTGAGMMDCKKALIESEGDVEKAIEILRKKGQKVAANRADREATEGIVLAKADDDHRYGVIVMVNSETDFVAKSESFVNFTQNLADIALSNKPSSLEGLKSLKMDSHTVEENLTDLVGKIGEKLEISGFEAIEAAHVSAYNHLGNKLATLVGLNKKVEDAEEIARNVAMQVAAMNPVAIDKEHVEEAIIEKEKEIGREQARQEGKPDNILDRIAEGKLNKFFKENTLLNQDYVKDSSKTVKQYLGEKDKELTVVDFRRLRLGV